MGKLHVCIDVWHVIRQSCDSSIWLLEESYDDCHSMIGCVQSHRKRSARLYPQPPSWNPSPAGWKGLHHQTFGDVERKHIKSEKNDVASSELVVKGLIFKFQFQLLKPHGWKKLTFFLFGWVVQLPTTVAFDSIFCFHLLILGREPYSFGHWNLPDSCAKDLEMPFMPESNMVPWQSWQCLAGRGIRSC